MYSLQGFPDEGSDNMKIEKVNENQIRCTLTREDLAERQIKLSELAYGTEKAKMLFRDMMPVSYTHLVGKHFCGIDAVIFQIADQCPDFNAILVTVINISGTCKGSNVSIVVV